MCTGQQEDTITYYLILFPKKFDLEPRRLLKKLKQVVVYDK